MTTLIPNHLPEPPPARQHDFQLDLLDGDRRVGWITPDTIGFVGFAHETEAAHAAWVAYRVLARRQARRAGRRPVPIDTEPLRLVTESAGRIIYGSRDRVAKLIEGNATPTPHGFGFELQLATSLDEISVRSKAHLIYRTLRRSGVKWSMWAPPAPSPASLPAPVMAAPLGDEEMIVGEPLALRDLAISVALLAMAVVAVIVPGAVAVFVALLGISGLVALRLTMLHAGWPPRRSVAPLDAA
ncbi:MAG: hypothetical protein ACREOK_11460 [Gemmatimonadaceae bacterium]